LAKVPPPPPPLVVLLPPLAPQALSRLPTVAAAAPVMAVRLRNARRAIPGRSGCWSSAHSSRSITSPGSIAVDMWFLSSSDESGMYCRGR
jgi:hypothetical protein